MEYCEGNIYKVFRIAILSFTVVDPFLLYYLYL